MRLLLNALPTRMGGGATVWEALVSGCMAADRDISFRVSTRDEGVAECLSAIDVDVDVDVVGSHEPLGGLRREQRDLKRAAADCDAVITHNRLSYGPAIPQLVLHVNLTRFSGTMTALGTRAVPAEALRNRLAKLALTQADVNVFESRYLAETAAARHRNVKIQRPRLAYVGISNDWLVPAEAPIPTLEERLGRLLAITSPNRHKDNPILIDLVAQLRLLSDHRWNLVIAGGNAQSSWSELRSYIREQGVEDRVEFLGFLNREALAEELDRSVALVSASRVESFAMVPVEAMARGIPAIVTNEASMPESVEDSGIAVDAARSDLFADAVLSLAADPDLWLEHSRNARSFAGQRTWTQFGSSILDAVDEIV